MNTTFAVAGERSPRLRERATGIPASSFPGSDPAGPGEFFSHTKALHILADRVEDPELRAELHDVTRKTAKLIVSLQFRIRDLKRKLR